ncbi:MAG: hypothetical protein AVDCRST_MAG36-2786 [uncultured Nocardioidaceae bacterium]|uniref:Uncharacterized protein n=1 Tax=uncultured Nocardioidaceae bacterium TaxID=253824 RepID=A0A6J4ML65_9ACTN|nr:MAG: hypothetical protein AVDCRST_MAG36-2786 [uncultured Nocardioidaceae bacterium]
MRSRGRGANTRPGLRVRRGPPERASERTLDPHGASCRVTGGSGVLEAPAS